MMSPAIRAQVAEAEAEHRRACATLGQLQCVLASETTLCNQRAAEASLLQHQQQSVDARLQAASVQAASARKDAAVLEKVRNNTSTSYVTVYMCHTSASAIA